MDMGGRVVVLAVFVLELFLCVWTGAAWLGSSITAKRTAQAHVPRNGWTCPGWHHPAHAVQPGELAADHPEPLVLGGEPRPAQPGVICSSCNARKGLSQRRR